MASPSVSVCARSQPVACRVRRAAARTAPKAQEAKPRYIEITQA
ncbi:hypothetical protein ABT115_11340 [Streptomyces sp. NPDC001832]